jgi:hypothetical protein
MKNIYMMNNQLYSFRLKIHKSSLLFQNTPFNSGKMRKYNNLNDHINNMFIKLITPI